VYFNLNTDVVGGIPKLREVLDTTDQKNIGLMVKTVQLPNYQLEVETMNQYNRKRLIQKKIDYNPCQFTFHDDGNDLIRNMWYNYFAYYYKDPTQQYWGVPVTQGSMGASGNGGDPKLSYNGRDIYNDDRPVNDWGYVGESYSDGTSSTGGKPPFFRDITIFGLANGPDGHQFCAYVLINPLITEWRHDTYHYSQGGGLMEHQMTVRYETVKYYSGKMNAKNAAGLVTGFAKEEITVTVESNVLTVRGESHLSNENTEIVYLHRGLATRDFVKEFPLAEHIEVVGAETKNGMLSVHLIRNIPESAKPKIIDIVDVK
jgi:hypothetical protein